MSMSTVEGGVVPAASAADQEARLIEALRQGDERAFETLIDRFHRPLLAVARLYVANAAAAEDVVQETWLAVVTGIDRFEGRASLKTWLCRIAANRARTRGVRESRSVAFSALWADDADDGEAAVDPDRFLTEGPYVGHWSAPPQSWAPIPEAHFLAQETRQLIQAAIEQLPPAQRTVLELRDVQGWSAEEVCASLEVTAVNQRVLLHRARSKVRAALETYLAREVGR